MISRSSTVSAYIGADMKNASTADFSARRKITS